ncbi:MAG: carboxylating nicotinate-nucleotide diphosphorylase, partial [Candidatus Omnitrophica bacterium]|nr:carboxylating nicotinate-nucleotide diphosphorylase [Candidatus Omnitrophota bacterium]
MDLEKKRVDQILRFALKEDIWTGDITTGSTLDRFLRVDSVILARGKGIVCGIDITERVFAAADHNLKFRPMVRDGERIKPDQEIAFIEGEAHSILRAERTALNYLGMLSGIATETRKVVDLLEGTGVKLYDTRKTIPLNRYFQKYAVKTGGGHNHRKGLWDMVLIKDNHIRAFAMQKKTSNTESIVREIIKKSRESVQKNIRIEIEVETLKECACALEESPDVIMLDNMSPDMVTEAVELRSKKGLEGKVLY